MRFALQGSEGSFLCGFAAEGKIKSVLHLPIYFPFCPPLFSLAVCVHFLEEQSSVVKLLFVPWHLGAS